MEGTGHFSWLLWSRKSVTAKRVTIIGATNVLSSYCASVEVALFRSAIKANQYFEVLKTQFFLWKLEGLDLVLLQYVQMGNLRHEKNQERV